MNQYFDEDEILINRTSFIFYDSFYKAMKYLNKDEKIEYIDAMCCYSLYNIRLEMSPKIEGLFELVKAQIDAIPIKPKQPSAIKDAGTCTYMILTESPCIKSGGERKSA